MTELLIHLLVSAALLMLVARLVRGIHISGWGSAILIAIVLGVVNAFVRPVMVFLTLPVTVVTFGLFLLVINACMLWLAAAIAPGAKVEGFWAALVGSLWLTVLNLLVGLAFGL